MRVLLVSSNAQVTAQIETALVGQDGVEIDKVPMPQAALARLDQSGAAGYDVVVADADTAPVGGMHLSREIKARGQMGRDMPPVVLLIAREADAWLSNWSQADAYVVKPADPFDLAEVLAAVAGGRPVPALPGVGGEPTPSLLDIPGPEQRMVAAEHDTGEGSDIGR